jgi:O-antigen ligase
MPLDRYVFSLPEILLLVIVCVLVIVNGRLEIAVGTFCAMTFWMENVFVGTIAIFWIVAPTVVMSGIIYWLKDGHTSFSIHPQDTDFLIWVLIWGMWITLLFFAFPPDNQWLTIRNLLGFTILPMIGFALIGSDIRRMPVLAYSFVGVTILSGWLAFSSLQSPLYALLQLNGFRLNAVTTVNAITFSKPFGISVVMLYGLLLRSKLIIMRLLYIGAIVFCCFIMFLINTRQTILGTAIATLIFSLWIFRKQRGVVRVFVLILLVGFITAANYLFTNTTLVDRWISGVSDGDIGGRFWIWVDAWNVFLSSPIWGSGLDYFHAGYFAHNIFLDVLAGQGLVGLVFLLGFLLHIFRYAASRWLETASSQADIWRMTALSMLILTLCHLQFSGGIIGAWDLFWFSALIWRLSQPIEEGSVSIKTIHPAIINRNHLSTRM